MAPTPKVPRSRRSRSSVSKKMKSKRVVDETAAKETFVPMKLSVTKTTQSMRTSLEKLHLCLLCPLCQSMFHQPVTLPACGHSFCQPCIDVYSCDSYECPQCSLPITLRGSRAGKFDAVNPQLETVVTSFSNLCRALQKAPDHWWKEPVPLEETANIVLGRNDDTYCFDMPLGDDDDEDDCHSNPVKEDTMLFEIQEEPEFDDEQVAVVTHLKNKDLDGADFDYDDDVTESFPPPSCLVSRRSCLLPPESPNCSVIAPAGSQLSANEDSPKLGKRLIMDESVVSTSTIRTDSTKKKQRQEPTKDILMKIIIASKLSKNDEDLLRQLEQEGKLEIVERFVDNQVIAVCGNPEIETGDGWLVGMTIPYLEAMARGCQIRYVQYFHTYPFLDKDDKNRVIGVGSSSDWMGPQRALEAQQKGTPLLDGYTLICVGDFKEFLSSQRGNKEDYRFVFTKDILQSLLLLCGAHVVNVDDMNNDVTIDRISDWNKVGFIVRPNPNTRDWRAARSLQGRFKLFKEVPIVSAKWFLDSLKDFRCKDWSSYTQSSR